MKGDFTRSTFRRNKHYSRVNLQQGRVQLDADWNEQVDIDQYHEITSILDIIGESGVPSNEKDGFSIKPADNSYIICKGRYYIEGILCENEKDYDASEQPDLPHFGEHHPCPVKPGTYLAYLDVWERHLTYLDDPYIRETALGGTDTSTRSKIVWQVKTLRIGDIGYSGFDISSSASWLHLKERSSGSLQAAVEKAGYRGLDNQLYRVEIHDAGDLGQATFKWSRDNGSIVSKVKSFNPIETKISVYVDGKDNLPKFAPGQWIEVLDDRHELWGIPGTMIQIQKIENNVITFDKDTFRGAAVANITYPQEFNPKIRRWDSTAGPIPITVDNYIDLEDGLQVKFGQGEYKSGDYWTIPARTTSRDIEWPRNGRNSIAMSPAGIKHRYSPLGLLEFNQNRIKLVTDYRKVFDTAISITSKQYTNSGTTSIIVQPKSYKIIGPIHHKCNSVNRNRSPPLVMLGLESYNSTSGISNMPDRSTVLHMDHLSLLTLLSDRYGQVVSDSKESVRLVNALGLDGSLKPLSTFPPFFKPILIDSEKFFILVANFSSNEMEFSLRWWAIAVN